MNPRQLLRRPVFWIAAILILLNILAVCWLLYPRQAELPEAQTIRSLYTIPDDTMGFSPVMEAMTAHGSVQYYANETDWLYFEQMAGGLRITLGQNAEDVQYTEYERGGVHYTLAEEPLGSELAWENHDGYLFTSTPPCRRTSSNRSRHISSCPKKVRHERLSALPAVRHFRPPEAVRTL